MLKRNRNEELVHRFGRIFFSQPAAALFSRLLNVTRLILIASKRLIKWVIKLEGIQICCFGKISVSLWVTWFSTALTWARFFVNMCTNSFQKNFFSWKVNCTQAIYKHFCTEISCIFIQKFIINVNFHIHTCTNFISILEFNPSLSPLEWNHANYSIIQIDIMLSQSGHTTPPFSADLWVFFQSNDFRANNQKCRERENDDELI